MKICVINIATNKYIQFIEPLWNDIKNNFLNDHQVESLLFTNHNIKPLTKNGKVSKIKHYPFPVPTLMRYHYILSEKEYLCQFDYCFYIDADMSIVSKVGEEILGDLTVTIHPYFWNVPKDLYTYERNPSSTAYIPYGSGEKYYAGGFNGGKTENFLSMSDSIAKNIDIDSTNDIIAIWHDESHLNKYMIDFNGNFIELSPSYVTPEGVDLPFEPKIISLNKNNEEIRRG